MPKISKRRVLMAACGPLIASFILLLFLFRMTLQSVRMGVPPRTLLWLGVLCSLGHAVSSWLAGRWVKPGRAVWVTMAGVVMMAAAGTVSLAVTDFAVYLAVSAAIGLATGHFFLSYQVMTGHAKPFRTLAWTLALMMFAGGMGEALGPFVCGQAGISAARVIGAWAWGGVLAYLALGFIVRQANRGRYDSKPVHEISSTPLMRNMSRVCAVAGMLLFCGTMAILWPGLGVVRGFLDREISLGSSMMLIMVTVSAFLWAALRRRMRDPRLMLCLAAVNGLAFVSLSLWRSYPGLLLSLALQGFSFSGLMFHCIYYGNADPVDAPKSVGVNEACFGIGALAGPALMGLLAWDDPVSVRPYFLGGLLALAGISIAAVMWRRNRARCIAYAPADRA